jgi:hypothetical protein
MQGVICQKALPQTAEYGFNVCIPATKAEPPTTVTRERLITRTVTKRKITRVEQEARASVLAPAQVTEGYDEPSRCSPTMSL